MIIFVDIECIDYSWFFTAGYSVFKLVDMRIVATCFLRGLRYANVPLTQRETLFGPSESARASPTPCWKSNRARCHVAIAHFGKE